LISIFYFLDYLDSWWSSWYC